jgi:hypothetical protein
MVLWWLPGLVVDRGISVVDAKSHSLGFKSKWSIMAPVR